MSHYLLHTERLTLRPCQMGDLDAIHLLWTDAEIRRFLFDDRPISREEAAAFIQQSESSFSDRGYGLWLFFERSQPVQITGFSGLLDLAGEMSSLIVGTRPQYWGRGYATEATSAVLTYAFDTLGLTRIVAEVDPPNGASICVLEALGMTRYEPKSEDGLIHYEIRSWTQNR